MPSRLRILLLSLWPPEGASSSLPRRLALTSCGADGAAGCFADPVYPPSLYKAISYASTLGVPVYILENGMPAKEDDNRRSDWINGYLNEVRATRSLRVLLPLATGGAQKLRWCRPLHVQHVCCR